MAEPVNSLSNSSGKLTWKYYNHGRPANWEYLDQMAKTNKTKDCAEFCAAHKQCKYFTIGPVLCWIFKGASGWEVNPDLTTFTLTDPKTSLSLDAVEAPEPELGSFGESCYENSSCDNNWFSR